MTASSLDECESMITKGHLIWAFHDYHVKILERMIQAKGTVIATAPRQEQECQVWGTEGRTVRGREVWDENVE